MFNYLQKKGTVFAILVLGFFTNLSAQQPCDGQEEGLPDTQLPVTGISSANPEAVCIYFRFDSDVTGMPIGITMDLWHEYEGDLSIFVEACGQTLNVLQRPGSLDNCDEGCSGSASPFGDCGSSAEIGTSDAPEIVNFFDVGPDPENGISSGGSFGLSLDDNCGVSTLGVNSFAELWSNCSPGLVEAEICFTDHATRHAGYVSNLNFIFPNPYVCGCMDPDAINYNPDASVSSGDCFYDCPDFGLDVPVLSFDLCNGADTITISASADLADGPNFEWIESGGTDFLEDDNAAITELYIPADFVGQLIYNLTVTDAFGCQEFETVVVNVGEGPDLQLLGETSVCESDSTWLYITGGPFETINWSTGATTDSIWTGAGNYSVTVTDNLSTCAGIASAVVSEIPAPIPAISGPDTICFGTSTTLFADTIYDSYLWSTAADTTFIVVDSAATYSLTVTDTTGCVGSNIFVLEVYDSLELDISGAASFCVGDSVILSATTAYDAYLWNTGDTTSMISANQAGSYTVTAIDTNACSVSATFRLTENPLPTPTIVGSPILCQDSVATLDLSQSYTSYLWSTSDTTATITTDMLGIYRVTVTDAFGCVGIAGFELLPPDPINVNLFGDTEFCTGDTATITATTGFSSYSWSDGSSDNPLRTEQAGVYELTVTNSQGCGATASIELSNYPIESPEIMGVDELCAGDNTTLNVAAGFSNYSWSTGESGMSIVVDSTASYTVQALDNNGCPATASFDIVVREQIMPEITGDSLICSNGSGVLFAPAGFDTYSWTGGSIDDSLVVNTAGTYNLTVTDDLNCTGTTAILVEEIVLTPVIEGESTFCAGGNTVLSVVDTFTTYQWAGGPALASFTVNTAGTYELTVTNDLGCEATTDITVDTWSLPLPSIVGDFDFCEGSSTTLASDATYTSYSWSVPNEIGQTLNTGQAGDYSLTVTDANGCQGADTVTIAALPLPVPTIEGVLQFCPEGGTTLNTQDNYNSYSWSTGGQTDQITIADIGLVGLTVTDSNNCEGSTSVETAHFPTTQPQIDGDLQFCEGDTRILTVSPSFSSYAWSSGGMDESITVSNTGVVSVTVTDINNCETEESVELTNYAPPVVAISGPMGLCEGGTALLSVVDTFQTYSWEGGNTGNSLSVSSPGTYELTVTTTNGCTAITQAELINWALPEVTISGDLSFCEGGSTTLNGNDGFSMYQWSVSGEINQDISTNQSGDYALTVTDDNGCQGADTVSIAVLPLPEPLIEGDLTFCPEGNAVLNSQNTYDSYSWSTGEETSSVTISQAEVIGLTVTDENNCEGSTTVATAFHPTIIPGIAGNLLFCEEGQTTLSVSPSFASYSWSTGEDQASIITSETGLLELTVTDENNCQTSNSVQLANYEPSTLLIGGLEGFCVGENTTIGVLDTFVNYQWSTGGQNAELEVAEAGDFTLIATDNNGCLAYDTFSVEVYELPLPQINGVLSFCTGNSTSLIVDGGDFVSYSWSDGSDNPGLEVSTAGPVSVTVTDTNGCENTSNEMIEEVSELTPSLMAAPGLCPGESTVIRLFNTYDTYLWSDGSMADSLVVDAAGQYELTVTNSQGCIGAGTIAVQAYETPDLEIMGIDYFCSGQSTILTAMSSDAELYNWSSGGSTATIEVEAAGDYMLTVTNLDGCSAVATQSIFEQQLPSFTLLGDAVFCEDSITTLQVIPAYATYSWSTGESTQSISVGNPGMVEVVVTDSLGCTSASEMELSNVPNPIAITGPDLELDCAITSVQLTSISQGDDLSYLWSGPGIDINNENDLAPWVNEEGTYSLIVTDTNYGCTSMPASMEVADLSYELEIELSVLNELDCNSSTVVINGSNSSSGPQYVYQWFDANNELITGADGSTYQANIAQLYTLLITDTLTSCFISETIAVETDEAYPAVDAGLDQQLDCGDPVASLSGSVVPNEDFISLQWTSPGGNIIGPDTELSTQADQTGWYFLQATDLNNGCTNLDSVLVTEDFELPTALTSGDVILFCNDENATLSGSGSSVGVDFQYQWLFNGQAITNATSLNYTANEPGIYTLEIIDESNNCSAIASLELSIDPEAPQAVDVQFVSPICAGDNNGSIQVANVIGGMSPYTYSLSDEPFSTTSYFGGLSAGNYDLILEDANGCQLSTNVELEDGNDLSVDLGEDQIVEWGEEVDIYPFVSVDSSAISQLTWQTVANLDCPDCLNQTDLLLDESTRFFLRLVDVNGCEAEDDVTIYVEKIRNIYVPNVFSPNGDGNNDRFFIFTDQKSVKEIKEMKIFNRWGVHVFENYNFQPNAPHEGWDGRLMGDVLNPDVFAWYAIVELIDGELIKLKGDVTLVK